MNRSFWKYLIVSIVTIVHFVGCSTQKVPKNNVHGYVNMDTIQAGPFDTGKMWTFDFPPVDYFKKTYNFNPSKEWFEKARLSALRLPNCSASFVSEDGLVLTNHHCARSTLDSANRENEKLPENGFYARTLSEERKVSKIYIDQLIVIKDVTDEIREAFDSGSTVNEKIVKQIAKIQDIQKRYVIKYKALVPQDSMIFNVVSLYNGGRFSLYGYKRYTDIRLVYVPEEEMGFFGGYPDGFTYPRYNFDCAFFRVYENARPLKTSNFFQVSKEGAKEGDAVFVIGNPGSTSRLETMAQLDFRRDYIYPTIIETNMKNEAVYSSYVKTHPENISKFRNKIFGNANARKATLGYLDALYNPIIMAKKQDFEKATQKLLIQNSDLKKKYGNPWEEIEKYQTELSAMYQEYNSLRFRERPRSQYLSLAFDLVELAYRSKDSISESARLKFYPSNIVPEIEKQFLASRLENLKKAMGTTNVALNELLIDHTPEGAAENLVRNTIFASKEKTEELLTHSPSEIVRSTDPLILFILSIRYRYEELRNKYDEVSRRLQISNQTLGRAILELYGTRFPPEANFTLRITDGIVSGYDYNGTVAPAITTFYGMYDRSYSFDMRNPWKLSKRWMNPLPSFKMSTPINFASTNDIIGGNSGSAVINKDLQLVGVIFDGNIESLSGIILYDDTKNRAISVHSAGILEGLEHIYKAERIVKELRAGKIRP